MRVPVRGVWVAAILAAFVGVSCAAARPPAVPVVTSSGVRFVLERPNARSVAVAGSFNEWSASAHPLVREGSDGIWALVVPLPPGEHTFVFVIDGSEWISPPFAADYMDDGFGSRNGVVSVRPAER
jgi:1,4-alpha-glucan branching enzyme